jgi:hypothetical protein
MLGRGKTYLTKQIVAQAAAEGEAVLVLDFFGEFQELAGPFVWVFTDVEQLNYFLDVVWAVASKWKKTLVVFDEVHQYTQPGEVPSWLLTKFVRLFRRSRHVDLEFICISQGAVDVPPKIRRLVEEFWYFQTTEVSDLEYIRKKWGDPAAETIKALPDRKFVKLFS